MKIPAQFKKAVLQAKKRILTRPIDVKALVVIGSVAEGDFQEDSDIDLVCVIGERISFDTIKELTGGLGDRIQLVPLSEEAFRSHFENCSTMAHSIQRGIVLYQKDGFLKPFLEKSLSLPKHEWMRGWFLHWMRFYYMGLRDRRFTRELHTKYCQEECHCHVSDILARVAVNLAILYLETKGVVPTTKRQIWEHSRRMFRSEVNLKGLRVALEVSHQDRDMNLPETEEVLKLASWLRRNLAKKLGVKKEDLKEMRRIHLKREK